MLYNWKSLTLANSEHKYTRKTIIINWSSNPTALSPIFIVSYCSVRRWPPYAISYWEKYNYYFCRTSSQGYNKPTASRQRVKEATSLVRSSQKRLPNCLKPNQYSILCRRPDTQANYTPYRFSWAEQYLIMVPDNIVNSSPIPKKIHYCISDIENLNQEH
jgi:hypothetical protein